MGSTYEISCRKCDYRKWFSVGIGMMYSPENLINFRSQFGLLPSLIRSKKTVDIIKGLLREKNAIIADNYGHAIYCCPKCGEFYERFFMHLDYVGGTFEPEYKCTKCKKKLKQVNDDLSLEEVLNGKESYLMHYKCPKCGCHFLHGKDGGLLWD